MKRILLSNAGRRTYLVSYLLDLVHTRNYDIEVYVSDTNKETASFWVSNEVCSIITPRVDIDPAKYVYSLFEQCKKHNIDIVIPLMDYELAVLSQKREEFLEHGINVIVSDPFTIEYTLDKKKNYFFCLEKKIKIPFSIFDGDDISKIKLPAIKKRVTGSGSVGLTEIKNSNPIPDTIEKGYLIQEKIEGIEYGMDILNDMEGNFIHCSVRKKLAMRSGETDKAKVLIEHPFTNLAKIVSKAFHHRGNMDIDFIVDESNTPWLIDFNPRFGGGYPFTHSAGLNYLKYIIDICLGCTVKPLSGGKTIIGAKGISIFFEEDKT